MTLTQGKGHWRSTGQNRSLGITPYKTVVESCDKNKCSIFNFLNISKYGFGHRTDSVKIDKGRRLGG